MEVRARTILDPYQQLIEDFYLRGYSITDDFIRPDTCAGILSELQAEHTDGQFHKAGIGKKDKHQVIHTLRGDFIKWLEPENERPHTGSYLEQLDTLRLALNRRCFLGLQDAEVHMTQYPPHTGYHKHVDAFHRDENRRISVVLYLNFHWKPSYDGRLRIYPEAVNGAPIDVYPKAGRLAIFESTLEHEVLPATQRRFSITGWLLQEKRFF